MRKRKRKQERDPRQPSRSPTAYILFNSDRRQSVIDAHAKAEREKQKANPGKNTGHTALTMVQVTKVLAQQWRDVSIWRLLVSRNVTYTCAQNS